MGLLKSLEKIGMSSVSLAWKGRIATGAVAGGIYGGMTSDSLVADQTLGSIGMGAVVGAGLGVASYPFVIKNAASAISTIGWQGIKTTPSLGKAIIPAGRFINQHPYAATGIGLGVYGASQLEDPNKSINPDYQAMEQQGISSTGLHQSTTGLTFGLHRRKHG
jgi:hypothetical protein